MDTGEGWGGGERLLSTFYVRHRQRLSLKYSRGATEESRTEESARQAQVEAPTTHGEGSRLALVGGPAVIDRVRGHVNRGLEHGESSEKQPHGCSVLSLGVPEAPLF